MPDMWRELDASHSQIATIAVPILLHSITFARDIMWRTLDRDFHPLPVAKHKLSKPGPEAPLCLVSQNGKEQNYKDVDLVYKYNFSEPENLSDRS